MPSPRPTAYLRTRQIDHSPINPSIKDFDNPPGGANLGIVCSWHQGRLAGSLRPLYTSTVRVAAISKKSFPLSKVYGLLEPGPVVLVTTAGKERANVMTMSWHTMMEFTPPLVGCVISNRNFTFDLLKTTRNCVINIPTVELAEKVVGCGNTSGRRVDKFKALGLTPETATFVKAPLIRECYANLECEVYDAKLVNKYNFFILEVLKAWIDQSKRDSRTIHHRGRGVFAVSGKTITLPSKMK